MPPRKSLAIAVDPIRRDVLRRFGLSEREMARLCQLPFEEAMWQMRHETDIHIQWAQERLAFVESELQRYHAPAPPPPEPVTEVTVVIVHDPKPQGKRLA